jgi:hypothetical protein
MLLWQIYLCGALVAAAGASVAADLFSERDVPCTTRTRFIVFAGVSWPVLLIGLLQLLCIGGLAKTMRTPLGTRHVSRHPNAEESTFELSDIGPAQRMTPPFDH